MRKTRGFTLVELLVVIGIIAVLISILLPSLARARQYANSISCASNLRSVGQGLLFYANDHKGKLPMSTTGGGHGTTASVVTVDGVTSNVYNGGWIDSWPAQVSMVLGSELTDILDAAGGSQYGNFNGNYTAVLRCPDVPIDYVQDAWNGGGFHYMANCRAMPRPGTIDVYSAPPGLNKRVALNAYPLAVRDASSKALLWDGPIYRSFGNSTGTNNAPQWWWYITWGEPGWGNKFADPISGTGPNMNDVAVADGAGNSSSASVGSANYIGKFNRDTTDDINTEAPWSNGVTFNYQRYRHLGDTSCNVLFFDGHVEAKKIGEITWGMLSIYPFK